MLKGFIVGLALTIIIGQLPKLGGLERGEGDFFEQAWDLVTELGDVDVTTLAVGLLSLAVVIGGRRLVPAVPWSLVAVALGVLAVKALSLDDHGVAIVGPIDAGLPSLGTPDVDLQRYLDLAAGAVGIALVGFAEGLGAAKTYAAREHYDVDANRELLGLGAANLASGLSQRHGRQRQPLQDRRERRGGRAQPALGPARRGADDRHAAAAHRPVRVRCRRRRSRRSSWRR